MSSDRDRILEQALKHELRATGTPAGACLDAETLGAWTDGALAPAAMAAAEAHVVTCARCLALVGTMARSTPVTSGADGALGTQGTFSLWKWWLAPIAAGVTAVTLWMVVPEQPPLAPVPAQTSAAKAEAPFAENNQPFAQSKDKQVAIEQPVDQLATRERLDAGARDDRAQNKLREEQKEESPKRQAQDQRALADAVVPAAPPAPPAAAATAAAPGAAAESMPAPKENAAAPQVAALQKRASSGFSPNAVEILALQASARWRIVGDYFVELSEDGGVSWQRKHQLPGVNTGLAVSTTVCWLAGPRGAVWLTTDGGATFRSVFLPEPLDVASVSATDARSANVLTISGRRFRTDDGGRTWRPF